MSATQKRATVYLDPEIHRALRVKAAEWVIRAPSAGLLDCCEKPKDSRTDPPSSGSIARRETEIRIIPKRCDFEYVTPCSRGSPTWRSAS